MAKLRMDQINSQLKQALAPVYLITGDEPLLVQEAADSIRSAAKRQGFDERERHQSGGQFDWGQLFASSQSLSLFSSKKLIELHIPNGKPGDKGSKAIVEFLEHANPDNCLLVITPKLDSGASRSKWVKQIEQAGHHIAIWPLSDQQFHRWLSERIKKAGLIANNLCIELLAERTEGNLLAAHQEIEKLALLVNDAVLSPEIISGSVANSARYDVFGMMDKALIGDARAAIKALQGLKSEGTDATIILWALARELRTLFALQQDLKNGVSFSQSAKKNGVWEKRKPLIQAALKRTGLATLKQAIEQSNQIDKQIKGLSKLSPWESLMELVLTITGNASIYPTHASATFGKNR